MRSMRRCSFSSSVFALLRGGRAVFGSGNSWPHDLRFLTGFVTLRDPVGGHKKSSMAYMGSGDIVERGMIDCGEMCSMMGG